MTYHYIKIHYVSRFIVISSHVGPSETPFTLKCKNYVLCFLAAMQHISVFAQNMHCKFFGAVLAPKMGPNF